MDRLAGQFMAQGGVDELVRTHQAEAGEGAGNPPHLQMIPTSGEVLHLNGRIGKGSADGLPDRLQPRTLARWRKGGNLVFTW